jgi:hypothetical protein
MRRVSSQVGKSLQAPLRDTALLYLHLFAVASVPFNVTSLMSIGNSKADLYAKLTNGRSLKRDE